MIRKDKLRLISGGFKDRPYTVCTIHLFDMISYEYRLSEWDVYKDSDWIEFHKKDESAMECYYVSNILRVMFAEVNGDKSKTDNSILKPVA